MIKSDALEDNASMIYEQGIVSVGGSVSNVQYRDGTRFLTYWHALQELIPCPKLLAK